MRVHKADLEPGLCTPWCHSCAQGGPGARSVHALVSLVRTRWTWSPVLHALIDRAKDEDRTQPGTSPLSPGLRRPGR
jgi:hypothetical protein